MKKISDKLPDQSRSSKLHSNTPQLSESFSHFGKPNMKTQNIYNAAMKKSDSVPTKMPVINTPTFTSSVNKLSQDIPIQVKKKQSNISLVNVKTLANPNRNSLTLQNSKIKLGESSSKKRLAMMPQW